MTSPDTPDAPFPDSPVLPAMLDGGKTIRFRCHRGVACWNACYSNIDISLTPYDILRLARRLELSTTEFLERYTVPYEVEKDGIAGVKLRPVEDGTACRFMQPEGCGVYADRPTACRYYPVALLSMRKQGEATDRDSYALVNPGTVAALGAPATWVLGDLASMQFAIRNLPRPATKAARATSTEHSHSTFRQDHIPCADSPLPPSSPPPCQPPRRIRPGSPTPDAWRPSSRRSCSRC